MSAEQNRSGSASQSEIRIVVSGSDVTATRARDVGAAYCDLFAAVAEAQGTSARLVVTGVKWMCDWCERTVPAETKPARWINREGLDYCEICQ